MEDILIIGAGMAGLAAGLECREQGRPFRILEADAQIGGRARSRKTVSGLDVDLGAQWLHGKDNPLRALLAQYGIVYRWDDAKQTRFYRHGGIVARQAGEEMQTVLNPRLADSVESEQERDIALPDLAKDDDGRGLLTAFAAMWDGLDTPFEPSAREYLKDKSTPGGYQLEGGAAQLLQRMAEDLRPFITCGAPVAQMANEADFVRVTLADGAQMDARRALFTGSLGVLKSGLVTFLPAFDLLLRKELAGIEMGRMTKIIFELNPDFFTRRAIPDNLGLELMDLAPPHFCHVRSAGLPLVTLYVSGPSSIEAETMDAQAAIDYARGILHPVKELAGFEQELVGPPIISGWNANPYTNGSYSACLPGGHRSGPVRHGHVWLCGDTFDTEYPASLAGAYRSGTQAAKQALLSD